VFRKEIETTHETHSHCAPDPGTHDVMIFARNGVTKVFGLPAATKNLGDIRQEHGGGMESEVLPRDRHEFVQNDCGSRRRP